MWIQHLVVLQFVHPAFMTHDLDLFSNSGKFKHDNFANFICFAEGDSNNANQNNVLKWIENLVDKGVLGNQGGNN
jgi:hypothetical protein